MTSSARFARALAARLGGGEHLLLYGPRGGGKTTLLKTLARDARNDGIPCGYAESTGSLGAITRAFADAYPDADTEGLSRRRARARLRLAAEARRGVLLLDHASAVNTQMVGFLRRLRGGVAGVVLAADVDSERERRRVRDWRLGAASVRMPPASAARLRRAFRAGCRDAGVIELCAPWQRQLVRAARGRIGWVEQCTRLLGEPRYWDGPTLLASVLAADAELALRRPDVLRGLFEDGATSSST